jgi:hypothetical protein
MKNKSAPVEKREKTFREVAEIMNCSPRPLQQDLETEKEFYGSLSDAKRREFTEQTGNTP